MVFKLLLCKYLQQKKNQEFRYLSEKKKPKKTVIATIWYSYNCLRLRRFENEPGMMVSILFFCRSLKKNKIIQIFYQKQSISLEKRPSLERTSEVLIFLPLVLLTLENLQKKSPMTIQEHPIGYLKFIIFVFSTYIRSF